MGKEMYRKIFLEELPRQKGYDGKRIDWGKCIGYKVRFIYDDIDDYVKIINYEYKKQMLTIKYKDKEFNITSGNFIKGKLATLLMKKTIEFIYDINQELKDDKRDIIITDREYKKDKNGIDRKWYKYTCNKCGWTEGWIIEGGLNAGNGCNVCCKFNARPKLGINTIWDTDRWMIDLGVSEEDAKSHTRCSGDRIEVTCPDCKNKAIKSISFIYTNKSIGCPCGRGTTYPEKFMMNVLSQLGIEFVREYSPDWAKPKRYDFYIPSLNMIIETHGGQHYNEDKFKRKLKEIQENDKFKKKIALNNNIKYYTEINCSKSEFDWMTFNIYKSLKDYFDMTTVNFGEAEKFALGNLVKEVCDYWKNKEEWESTYTVAKKFNLARSTITEYLKRGVKQGWCNYDPKEVRSKRVEIFRNGISLGVFKSCSELERKSEDMFGVKLYQGAISSVCRGECNFYKGFKFKYI